MIDLVERLHAMANVPEVDFDPVVINEAADRIAALEAALREGVLVSREDFADILENWEYAAQYKGDYLRKKHGDDAEIAEYREKYASAALAPEQDK